MATVGYPTGWCHLSVCVWRRTSICISTSFRHTDGTDGNIWISSSTGVYVYSCIWVCMCVCVRACVRVCVYLSMYVCCHSLTGINTSKTQYMYHLQFGWLVIRAEPHFRSIIRRNTKLVFNCAPPVHTRNKVYIHV